MHIVLFAKENIISFERIDVVTNNTSTGQSKYTKLKKSATLKNKHLLYTRKQVQSKCGFDLDFGEVLRSYVEEKALIF